MTDHEVYEAIHSAILNQQLPPGTKLTEERLSELFGVSRERIRKVIQRLGHDRCVDQIPNRGAFVAQPSVEDARQVFEARRVIESHLVEKVAQQASPEVFERLEANLSTEGDEHRQGLFPKAVSTSGNFHLLLAEAAGNAVLTEMLRDLIARSSLILSLYGEARFDLCALDEHRDIVKKLRQGHVAQARKLMVEHLQEIEDNLRLDRPEPGKVDLATVFGRQG